MSQNQKDLYYYQPSELNELSSKLAMALEGMEVDGNSYLKAATVNTVIPVDSSYDVKRAEDLIYTLSLVHPNRAFLVVLDEKADKITAEFSTRCHKISQTEHICSEVVRIKGAVDRLADLKNLIRSNLVTGMNTELVLSQAESAVFGYGQFADLCEQIIFSSAIFERDYQQLGCLLEGRQALIDLSWVSLGIWRDQVKEIFDISALADKLSSLQSIEILYSSHKSGSMLFGGWVADRLKLDIRNEGAGEAVLYSHSSDRRIALRIRQTEGESALDGLQAVHFRFASDNEYVSLQRNTLLESEISVGGEKKKITRIIDNLSYDDLLKRYFFIGESTVNYRSSMANALKLRF